MDRQTPAILDLSPLLAWGVFTRSLALVFAVALTSLSWRDQLVALSGARGITPLNELHTSYIHAYGIYGAIARFPSIYWFVGSSDAALRWIPRVGVISALAVAVGLLSPLIGIGIAWLAFLSVDVGSSFTGAIFPWDCLLLEAGALGVWLPHLARFPNVSALSPVSPLLSFAFRFLLFRVLIGFGKLKFMGADIRRDTHYIRGFLINMPIVHPLGFFLHRILPRFMFPSFLLGMAITELIAPWGLFWIGLPRFIAATSIIGLMIGIQCTGNFGHFNLLTSVLAIPSLLDPNASLFSFSWLNAARTPYAAAETAYLTITLLVSLIYFPANSWVNLSLPYWPAWDRIKLLSGLCSGLRKIAPLRTVSAYGVFGPTPAPPQRWVPVYQGSNDDGLTWHDYIFQYYPTNDMSPPCFVAPHHPRLDHSLVYDSIGLNGHSPLGILNHGNAFGYTRTPTAMRLALRLLEGASPSIRALFKFDPFPNKPPTLIRVRLRVLRPTPLGSTAWWRSDDVATHIAAISLSGPLGSTLRLGEKSGDWAAARWDGWLPRGPEDVWFEAARERRDAWPQGESERLMSTVSDEKELWRSVLLVRASTIAAVLNGLGDEGCCPIPEPLHHMRIESGSRRRRTNATNSTAAPVEQPSSLSQPIKIISRLNDAARLTLQLAPPCSADARRHAALTLSPDKIIDVKQADIVFTWRHLSYVVSMERATYNDISREKTSRAIQRALLPAFTAAERVWWRPAPDVTTLTAEIAAYDMLRKGINASSEIWAPLEAAVIQECLLRDGDNEEWRSRYLRLSAVDASPRTPSVGIPIQVENVNYDIPTAIFSDNDDSPGPDGAGSMRNHMRLAFYIHWRALLSGQASFSPILSALRDSRIRETAPLPLIFRALAPSAMLDPCNAATETSSFLWAIHNYDALAAAGEKAWIVASTMKPPRVGPISNASIGPAFAEIMPRATAHYIHSSLRPFDEKTGKPGDIAWVPTYRVREDGDFEEIE